MANRVYYGGTFRFEGLDSNGEASEPAGWLEDPIEAWVDLMETPEGSEATPTTKTKKRANIVGEHLYHKGERISRHPINREIPHDLSVMVAKMPTDKTQGSGEEYLHLASLVTFREIPDNSPSWRLVKKQIESHPTSASSSTSSTPTTSECDVDERTNAQAEHRKTSDFPPIVADDALLKASLFREFMYGITPDQRLEDLPALIFDDDALYDGTPAAKAKVIAQLLLRHQRLFTGGTDSILQTTSPSDQNECQNPLKIVDLCAGIGGNTWQFLKLNETTPVQVEAVEASEQRAKMLQSNLDVLIDGHLQVTKTLLPHMKICAETIESWAADRRDQHKVYDWCHISPPWGGNNYAKYSNWWGVNSSASAESTIHPQGLKAMDLRKTLEQVAGLSQNYLLFVPRMANLVEAVWTGAAVLKSTYIEITLFTRSREGQDAWVTNCMISYVGCKTLLNEDHLECTTNQTIKSIAFKSEDFDSEYLRSGYLAAASGGIDTIKEESLKSLHAATKLYLSDCDRLGGHIHLPLSYHTLMGHYNRYCPKKYCHKGLQVFTGARYDSWDKLVARTGVDAKCDRQFIQRLARTLVETLQEGSDKETQFIFYLDEIPLRSLMQLLGVTLDLHWLCIKDHSRFAPAIERLKDVFLSVGKGDLLIPSDSDPSNLVVPDVIFDQIKFSAAEREEVKQERKLAGVFHMLIKLLYRPVYNKYEKLKKTKSKKIVSK